MTARVRAVANGNIYNRSAVPRQLIGSVFLPIEDEPQAESPEKSAPEPDRAEVLFTPEAELQTVAHRPPAKRRTSTRRKRG